MKSLLLKMALDSHGEVYRGVFCVSEGLCPTKMLFPPPSDLGDATLCVFLSTAINCVCYRYGCHGSLGALLRYLLTRPPVCILSTFPQFGHLKIFLQPETCPFLLQVHSLLCLPLPWLAVNTYFTLGVEPLETIFIVFFF